MPEYGFSSKVSQSFKKKKFQPVTPAKKGKSHMASYDQIYSPCATLLTFHDSRELTVSSVQTKGSKFANEFDVLSKIGEGSFGEAFRVRSRLDGNEYAIKKAKQKYLGYRDREAKLSEVHQSLKLSQNGSPEYRQYCMAVFEAWEESGYLFIRSELCELGNLNDYIIE